MELLTILGFVLAIAGFGVVGVVTAGGDAGQSADPAPSPGATGADASADPAPSPGAQPGSGAPSPGASPADSPNMRQLREQYEALKSQYEPYSKLGKPEEISSHVAIARQITEHAVSIGTELGYSEQEIREALAADSQGTLEFLRTKQAEAQQSGQHQPDVKKTIQAELNKALKPIQDRETKRLNDEANFRFDSTFDQELKALFKGETLAEDERGFLYGLASHFVAGYEGARERLLEGKTGDVKKSLDEARSQLDKYYLARAQREAKRAPKPGGQGPSGQPEKKSYTLDDIIEDPGKINPRYA